MGPSLSAPAVAATPLHRRHPRIRKVLAAVAVLGIASAVGGAFTLWPHSPDNLGNASNAVNAALIQQWQAGDMIVLVRHAERCDRSSNPCLGPTDGITLHGSQNATIVGQALKTLGLSHTDLLTSPTHRTAQTAHYMMGGDVAGAPWLSQCDHTLLADSVAHKVAQRNLIVVTHSGCIGHVEKQMGYPRAEMAPYSSALFLSVDKQGKPTVMGMIKVEDWPKVVQVFQTAGNQNKL